MGTGLKELILGDFPDQRTFTQPESLTQCASLPEAPMGCGRILASEARYGACAEWPHTRYGACAECLSVNCLRRGWFKAESFRATPSKTKFSFARTRARTLEIKISGSPSQWSLLGDAKPPENQRDTLSSGYHWAIRSKGFEDIALYARSASILGYI